MNQLDNFDSNFVKATVEEWRIAAEKYQREAAQAYKKLRSYLTLYQFRLDDAQKCDIREKISETLDEIENNDGFLKDMDSYLDGFCFALDKSVLRFRTKNNDSAKHDSPLTNKPTIANVDQEIKEQSNSNQVSQPDNINEFINCDPTLDCTDLDYYTLQFFQ